MILLAALSEAWKRWHICIRKIKEADSSEVISLTNLGYQKLQTWLKTSVRISRIFLWWKLSMLSWNTKKNSLQSKACFFLYILNDEEFPGLQRVAPAFLCTYNGRILGDYYSLNLLYSQRYSLSHSNRNPPIPRPTALTHKPAFRYANNNILLSVACPIYSLCFIKKVYQFCTVGREHAKRNLKKQD